MPELLNKARLLFISSGFLRSCFFRFNCSVLKICFLIASRYGPFDRFNKSKTHASISTKLRVSKPKSRKVCEVLILSENAVVAYNLINLF